MRVCSLLVHVAVFVAVMPIAAAVDLTAAFTEFDRAATPGLWPGFEPTKIPVAVYDGKRTWLWNHPSPPPEFTVIEGAAGLRACKGLHEAVRANTSVKLGGVLTATVMLDRTREITPRAAAALIAHECFHVYERQHHPDWQGNEAVLFTYPVEDSRAAALAILELAALRRARASGDRCWAAQFASLRRSRFALIGPDAAQYERLTELNEGLAQHIQNTVNGAQPDLSHDYSPAEVRDRAYAVGPAIAAVLDAVTPGWKNRVTTSLDELIPGASGACDFTESERESAATAGARQVAAVIAGRDESQRSFEAAPGWRVVLVAGAGKPLMPAGFDPMNVERLDGGHVLHKRWLKLANDRGSAEAMNHRSITAPAGEHPLFGGVRTWTILLDGEPRTKTDSGAVQITGEGFELKFNGAKLEAAGHTLTVRLD
jgi:hypothetical protein